NAAASRARRGGRFLALSVTDGARRAPRRAENGHTVAVPPRGPQAREVVDHIPQAEDGVHEHLLHAFLVGQAHPIQFLLHRIMRAHLSCSLSICQKSNFVRRFGTRSITSMTRWRRAVSFSIASSSRVLMLPFSL